MLPFSLTVILPISLTNSSTFSWFPVKQNYTWMMSSKPTCADCRQLQLDLSPLTVQRKNTGRVESNIIWHLFCISRQTIWILEDYVSSEMWAVSARLRWFPWIQRSQK